MKSMCLCNSYNATTKQLHFGIYVKFVCIELTLDRVKAEYFKNTEVVQTCSTGRQRQRQTTPTCDITVAYLHPHLRKGLHSLL